ncbi:MAG: hypothetical protein DRP54_07070 [Spirochaetes bacterium]|nr:MAG: hypothetical protein DRP54_07070 [Spirochaetota bacterium]
MLKKINLTLTIILFIIASFTLLHAQENKPVIRILKVDWYVVSQYGVKLQYRTFDNTPIILYLPKSFENKIFRFIEPPNRVGDIHGVPALIVHMNGGKLELIDIYVQHNKKDALLVKLSDEDVEKFREIEKIGKVDIKF